MKKCLLILCLLILAFALVSCGIDFDGSRTGNDSEFIMDYKVLNTTDSQNLTIAEGDTLHAEIIVKSGSLSFKVQKNDSSAPIYEDKDVSASNEFDIVIEESGTYTVTVTGEKAEGSVSFTVN